MMSSLLRINHFETHETIHMGHGFYGRWTLGKGRYLLFPGLWCATGTVALEYAKEWGRTSAGFVYAAG